MDNIKIAAALAACDLLGIKQAGAWSEYGGMLNPLNLVAGNTIGALAALATKTKSLKQQSEDDNSNSAVWSNLLVPGVAAYRAHKRLGTSIRGPELAEMRSMAEKEKAEAEAAAALEADAAAKKLQAIKQAGVGGGAGGLYGAATGAQFGSQVQG